jgi:hypothetical protein
MATGLLFPCLGVNILMDSRRCRWMEMEDEIEYRETDDVTLEEAERLRHFDDGSVFEWVCPFTREPCGDVDLCWSALELRDLHRHDSELSLHDFAKKFNVVKDCALTNAKYLVRKHRIRVLLIPK